MSSLLAFVTLLFRESSAFSRVRKRGSPELKPKPNHRPALPRLSHWSTKRPFKKISMQAQVRRADAIREGPGLSKHRHETFRASLHGEIHEQARKDGHQPRL